MSTIEVRPLTLDDASALAPLIAAYAQHLRRGAPRRPDKYYAEALTKDRTAEVVGAMSGGELTGFAVFFDLPEPVSGTRRGQLSDMFVVPDHRGKGVGRRLVDALVAEGQSRGWSTLRWLVPAKNDGAAGFSGKVGEPLAADAFEVVIDRIAAGA